MLAQHMDNGALPPEEFSRTMAETMEHASAALPGLGDPTPVIIDATSAAVGRSLSEVNLRGLTGATVLAIFRTAGHGPRTLVPTGRERLQAGDVLTLAGSHEAIAAAREELAYAGSRAAGQERMLKP